MKSTVVTIRLDRQLAKRISKISRLTKRKKSDCIRLAIEEYCDNIEFEILDRHGKEAGKKLGLFTDEDVIRWLGK